ncbi:MAG: phage portal protein [Verrucomicrobiota bacterium]
MKRGNFASSLMDAPAMNVGATAGSGEGAGGPFMLLSGYSAANHSTARGYLYWPESKTRFEMTPLASEEIKRRIHFLVGNFGFPRRLLWGMAQAAGMVTPVSDTGESEWDDLVEANWLERVYVPEIFDAAAKFDFGSAQTQLDVNRWKDGDCLVVPTDPEGYDGVQLAFYEGTQITQFGGWQDKPKSYGPEWWDGVKTDDIFGKHLAYRVQSGSDRGNYEEIDAESAYYYANRESNGSVRGISILASIVNNMVDVVETRGFVKKRIKESANIRPVIETDAPAQFAGGGGMGAQVVQTAVPLPDGTSKSVNWEVMMGGGDQPPLAPGQKIRLVADDRPTPNNVAFEETLLRDCSHAAGIPHEMLFAMADLKGPSQRYVMAQMRRWVGEQMRYKTRFVRWYRALHISNEIEAGRLPRPRQIKGRPLWWLKSAYIGQSDMTIDEGRKGKLALINLRSGLTTWAKEYGELGLHWKTPIAQRLKELSFAREKAEAAGFTLDQAFPEIFKGSQSLQP